MPKSKTIVADCSLQTLLKRMDVLIEEHPNFRLTKLDLKGSLCAFEIHYIYTGGDMLALVGTVEATSNGETRIKSNRPHPYSYLLIMGAVLLLFTCGLTQRPTIVLVVFWGILLILAGVFVWWNRVVYEEGVGILTVAAHEKVKNK
ncbi:MAG: hypothetical protein AAF125_04445 [Chloroflexota bacterium]